MAAATFTYRVRDSAGKVHNGELEGDSTAAVARLLQKRGLIPLAVEEKRKSALQKEIALPGWTRRVRAKDLAVFSRQFATMIDAGLPLIRSLSILEEQTESAVLQETLGAVRADVEHGISLSDAMAQHPKAFPGLYTAMIRAGEVGGVLDETLNRLAEMVEAQVATRAKVRSAMAYPVVVLGLVILIVTAMLLFVVPMFQHMYSDLGGDLPLPTRFLIGLSTVFKSLWWLLAAATAGALFGFRRWVATEAGRHTWDSAKLNMPVFGRLVHRAAMARFGRTLAALTRTGVPILQAIDIVAEITGNSVIARALSDVKASVKEGQSIAGPLGRHPIFPPLVVHLVAIGEETGAIDTMLDKIADFYDAEVEAAVTGLTSLVEPLLIVVMGVTVGGILIALYLPMFNIAELIQ